MASKKLPAKKDPAPAKSAAAKSAPTKSAPTKSAAAAKSAPAKPAVAKPSLANPSQAKTSQAKTSQAKTSQAKNSPVKTSPVKTSPGKTSPVKAPPVKSSASKPSPAKPAAKSAPAVKSPAPKPVSKSAPAAATRVAAASKAGSKKVAAAPAAKADPKPAAKTESKPGAKPGAKNAAPAPAPAAKSGAKPAATAKAEPAKTGAKGGKAKTDENETPIVPKKGPIDLAQHKSVAEAAAAVANARGGTGEFIIINGRRVRAISTKGISVAKKTKTTTTEAAAGPSEQQIREIKTKLGKKELDEYRLLLHAKRRQLVGMLSGMEDEALRSSGGNLSNMPVHMADMGSDVYEQDFTLGMAETERAIITEIDAALQRIEDKTFGVCQMTGKPISKARLDAKPWAKYTIEAERIAESSGSR